MNHVFISGEKIDLCVPGEADFEPWASWFNDQETTQYLEQGKYPNTPLQQREFYENAISSGRFLCMIKTKDGDLLGVISLSEINYEKGSCQVAYVCPVKSDKAYYAPLEALAICVQHAFERLGMQRVWAGHSYPGLHDWIQKTEIIGFKTDGIIPLGFHHGIKCNDAARTSLIKERYLSYVKRRGGRLWPGEIQVRKMLNKLKEHPSLASRIHDAISKIHKEHDQLIAEVERNARQ